MPIHLICKLFTIVVLCVGIAAQSTQQTAYHRQVALLALQQLRTSVDEIENDCGKLCAQMQLADLLWGYDERQARQLFVEAFQRAFASKLTASQTSCTTQSRETLGFAILERMARRDVAWAQELVEAVSEPGAPRGAQVPAETNWKTRLRDVLASYQLTAKTGEVAPDAATNHPGQLIRTALFGTTPSETNFSSASNATSDFAPLNLLASSATAESTPMNSQLDTIPAVFRDFQPTRGLPEKISDPQTRQRFEQMIGYFEITAIITAGQFEEALRRAQALVAPLPRIMTLVQIAQAVRQKKGVLRAVEVLSLAEQSLAAEPESREKIQAFIALAAAMTELEVERGFALAQTAITLLNALRQEATAQREENGLESLLERLSAADFARAWGLVMNIHDRELAWFTKLAICRAILTETEEHKGREKQTWNRESSPSSPCQPRVRVPNYAQETAL
jgi:hypothetical protein